MAESKCQKWVLNALTNQPDGELNKRNTTCVTGDIKMDLKRKEQYTLGVFFSNRRTGRFQKGGRIQYLSSIL